MIKKQLEALMTRYNECVEPFNRLSEMIDRVENYIEAVQAGDVNQNCTICKFFNEGMGETCSLAKPVPMRPPASVIVTGCDAFVHKDYDENDAKEAVATKDKRRRFARDMDDEIPF